MFFVGISNFYSFTFKVLLADHFDDELPKGVISNCKVHITKLSHNVDHRDVILLLRHVLNFVVIPVVPFEPQS